LILSRQLSDIIELNKSQRRERKLLSIQIIIEKSCKGNKSFEANLKQFLLNEELRRLFLSSLDLYINNNDFKTLRYLFIQEN
jgi:hypothetical protein